MNVELKDVITEEFKEQIQDSFAFATGFGVVFADLEGNHLGEGSNFTRFCTAINNTKEGAACCALTNRNAIELAIKTQKPCIYVCHAGLINIEIPLIYNGNYIGAITAGQVLCTDMNCYPKDTIVSSLDWLKTEESKAYFSEIKALTRQQIEATAKALENISNYVIQQTMYNKLQENLIEEHKKTLEYERQHVEMEHQLKLAKLDVLQKQVTPHFVFNVIGSISRLISMNEYSKASDMLDSFAQMLRYSLSNIRSTITLQQEVNYIHNYLAIQKHRFAERIEYDIKIDDEAFPLVIPFFSIQPLIENGIEHGILTLPSGGRLTMSCSVTNKSFLIEIKDNGKGISARQLGEIRDNLIGLNFNTNNHVGLYNSYNRFKIMYGENVNFIITSELNKGTNILIEIAKDAIV